MLNSEFHIFFDDGGVLNDNSKRSENWKRLIAEFCIPKYGGTEKLWFEANQIALENEIGIFNSMLSENPHISPEAVYGVIDPAWIDVMFTHVGVELPEDFERFNQEIREYVVHKAHAPYSGIIDAVNTLADNFTNIHTASNEDSDLLDRYLKGMQIRHHFGKLFGPDIIGHFKTDHHYYELILNHLSIKPDKAIFIDDRADLMPIISRIGATPIQSLMSGSAKNSDFVYNEPSELVSLINQIVF